MCLSSIGSIAVALSASATPRAMTMLEARDGDQRSASGKSRP